MARLDPFDWPAAIDVAAGSEEAIYRDRARRLGLPYTTDVDLGHSAESDLSALDRGTFAKGAGHEAAAYVAPDESSLAAVGHWLGSHPSARRRLQVATPTAIRAALRHAGRRRYHADALARLAWVDPSFSARVTITRLQALVGMTVLGLVVAAFLVAPTTTVLTIDLVAAAFFLGVSLLRFAAASQVPHRLERPRQTPPDVPRPVYTVLVPLLNEAHIVEQLVASLDRLDWPGIR